MLKALSGSQTNSEHLDGSFYYPEKGIGDIVEKIEAFCGESNIRKKSRITRIFRNSKTITSIELNNSEVIEVDKLVSTVPITHVLEMLEPPVPKKIMSLSKGLRYRNTIIVTVCLKRERVTTAATIYFPSKKFLFTRMYEAKNRSSYMSPANMTSLTVEIPCYEKDPIWNMEDEKIIDLTFSQLEETGWIKREEVITTTVNRLNYTYPVLRLGFEKKINSIITFLKRFDNLEISGRNGQFIYGWIHNMMRSGKEIIENKILTENDLK